MNFSSDVFKDTWNLEMDTGRKKSNLEISWEVKTLAPIKKIHKSRENNWRAIFKQCLPATNEEEAITSSIPLKGLSHEMDLAFDDMYG